jgi:hypothetical protein
MSICPFSSPPHTAASTNVQRETTTPHETNVQRETTTPHETNTMTTNVRRETMTTQDTNILIVGAYTLYYFETMPPGAPIKAPRVVSWDEDVREYSPGGTIAPRTLFPPPGFEKSRQPVAYSVHDPSSYDSPPPNLKSVVDVDTRCVLFRPESPIGSKLTQGNDVISPVTFL